MCGWFNISACQDYVEQAHLVKTFNELPNRACTNVVRMVKSDLCRGVNWKKKLQNKDQFMWLCRNKIALRCVCDMCGQVHVEFRQIVHVS